MSDDILVENFDSFVVIKLHRPEVYNGLTFSMLKQLYEKLNELEKMDSLKVIAITGSGKGFCSGQDLKEASQNDFDQTYFRKVLEEGYNKLILKITRLKLPVVALVNGIAAGAGASLAFACDFILSSSTASFVQAFSNIGLIPDSGGSYFLPRLVGNSNAKALMMTGESLSAEEAKQFGIVYKVFDEAMFEEESNLFMKKIASKSKVSLKNIKKVFLNSSENSLKKQLEVEAKIQLHCLLQEDIKEGVNAFLEKRNPVFK